MKAPSSQETHYNQARASLQQALSWYSSFQRHGHYAPNETLQAAVRGELQTLKRALDKIEQNALCIAAFGLVSRGKSAVLNSLIGQNLLETGPLHGVTKYPRSVTWTPLGGKIKVELIDTPGLDEIEGQGRAQMAKEVAQQADLILFIVAGDITRTEYEALCELRQAQKPLILVFNKVDLYPECDRTAIYQQLQTLATTSQTPHSLQTLLSPDDIVMVAAQPAPIPLRIEWPDGQIQETLETPPPQIYPLQERILTLLNQEGRSLLALNALLQAQAAEQRLARKTIELRAQEAETLIWRYAKTKALVVALNPIALLDLLGGLWADLALIRALARLYGLPMTSYQAVALLSKILTSAGTLFLAELASTALFSLSKSSHFLNEGPAALTTYATTAALQGAIAGYGSYIIGKAAQDYLEKGCSWGALGASTVIQEILGQIDPKTIIYRLRDEISLA
ncbi:GTP-binding protein [Spirulina subsalsa]|uniref:GTP-binding protein n=1 Tax=Spirulina subsalsa TaxID=54311 RepID=UPI0002ED1B33|nr:GTP-binding protein [Spirulina subsalsa]